MHNSKLIAAIFIILSILIVGSGVITFFLVESQSFARKDAVVRSEVVVLKASDKECFLPQITKIEKEEESTVEEVVEDYYEPEYEEVSYNQTYQPAAVSEGILTRSGGVNNYGGRTETWYSQKVLPGMGLDIPGRHVDESGLVRDGDGYICVAASDINKGSIVETSLGTAKVYDNGCAAGVTDIYTNW